MQKPFKKGRGVRIVGRLKQDRWEDTEGKVQYRVKIVAEKVEFRPLFSGNGKDGDSAQIEDLAPAAEDHQQEMAEVF